MGAPTDDELERRRLGVAAAGDPSSALALALAGSGWGLQLPPRTSQILIGTLVAAISSVPGAPGARPDRLGGIEVARTTPLAAVGRRRLLVDPVDRSVWEVLDADAPQLRGDRGAAGSGWPAHALDLTMVLESALVGLLRHSLRAHLVRGQSGMALARRALTHEPIRPGDVLAELDGVDASLVAALAATGALVDGLEGVVGNASERDSEAPVGVEGVPAPVAPRVVPSTLLVLVPTLRTVDAEAAALARWVARWWVVDRVAVVGPRGVATESAGAIAEVAATSLDPADTTALRRQLSTAMREVSVADAMVVLGQLARVRAAGGSVLLGAPVALPSIVLAGGVSVAVPDELRGIVQLSER